MEQTTHLNLAEKFIVLAMHPNKPRYLISDQAIIAGLTGAILLDLTLEGKLEIRNQILHAKSGNSQISATHAEYLNIIQTSTKERKIKHWIQKFTNKSQSRRKQIHEGLKSKGFVKIEYKRFLFIPYIKAYLIRKNERSKLIEEIRSILIYSKKPNAEMAPILGLIEAGKMYRVISKNRSEVKDFRKKLKEIMKSDLIASGVNQVITEMQAAVTAAIIVSTVAVTSAGR